MKNKLITIFLAAIFWLALPFPVEAEIQAGASARLKNEVFGLEKADVRTEKLTEFLKTQKSPLAPYAQTFVKRADQYEIDWRLVAAIAGVESSFGKRIPFDSYNAYGWANGAYQFESWEQSIDHVSKVLAEKYYGRGLDTPAKIGPVYAPPSSTWASKVIYFMAKIEPDSRQLLFTL